ncbi:hypothetical protein HYX06_04820 [Candidatus Woesearchaeota archaeon]|nr:hypothetical protein [Candidatus Woesearchaeota archaeon]
MGEEKITLRRMYDALLIERARHKRIRAEEAERELASDWERVQSEISPSELERMIEKYDIYPASRIINDALELLKRGLKRSKDLTKKYGPVVVKRVKDTTTKYSPVVGKSITNSTEILSLLYNNLVKRPVGWTYTNWVETPVSRIYGTLEKSMVDSPVTQSVVETSGNVARTGIKYTAIAAALLGSAMLAAEAYRPGTVDKVSESVGKSLQGTVQQLQRLYQGIILPPSFESVPPEYNEPLPPAPQPGSRKV